MIASPAALEAIKTEFKSSFQKVYDKTPCHWQSVATRIASDSSSNTYGWLGQFPDFSEWIDKRQLKGIDAYGYKIENKDWESTITIHRNDVEDDIGVYRLIFEEMGRAAKVFPDKQVFGLLAEGFSELCYDGRPFFASDHPVGNTTVSNLQEGSALPWYLMDTSRPLKPLIYQERKAPVFVARDGNDDEPVFMRNELQYGTDLRCNVGFGLWQTAYGSKAELTTDSFNDAWAAMTSMKSPEGRPLGVNPTLLVIPPRLRTRACEVVKAERLANGASNVNHNLVDVLVCPWLT